MTHPLSSSFIMIRLSRLKTYSYKSLTGVFILLTHLMAHSQSLPSQLIDITINKTSSIIFPCAITSVDRGSRDVLAQKAKGMSNVLQVKAGKPGFKETNLTIITADGELHHFIVHYAEHPSVFVTRLPDSLTAKGTAVLFDSEMTESEMEITSKDILALNRGTSMEKDGNFDMKLILKGIYIHHNMLFFHLKVINKSNISFHTDMLRFSVKDKLKVKRMAAQEITEVPLHIYGDPKEIAGKSYTQLIYAIPKFTIPDAKRLNIELMEKRGGRHLHLTVKNKQIVGARTIVQ